MVNVLHCVTLLFGFISAIVDGANAPAPSASIVSETLSVDTFTIEGKVSVPKGMRAPDNWMVEIRILANYGQHIAFLT